MSLIPQDNTGSVAGANSYNTVVEFKAYHDARGNDYANFDDDAIEIALIKGTDYADIRFRYVGRKRTGRDQTTEWPRTNAYDRDRYYINDVPREIKEAVNEYALRALSGTLLADPLRDDTGVEIQSKSEKVGPIDESITYVNSANYVLPRYPLADYILKSSGLVQATGILRRG